MHNWFSLLKCWVSIFSLAAGTSYNLLLCFPPFLFFLWLHPGRTFSRTKVPCTVLGLCFHLVCGSPCQCWGSTQALHRHSSSTSACSLHCCQYCSKRQLLVTLLEWMTLHLGRLAGTCGRYLFSTANAGSNAHLLINLHQSYRKALVLHNHKLHQKPITLITGLRLLQHGELRLPTTALLHFIASFIVANICRSAGYKNSGSLGAN